MAASNATAFGDGFSDLTTPIDAGFEAKQPASLHIYRAGERGPQPPSPERIVGWAFSPCGSKRACVKAPTEGFMRDPNNAKPHRSRQDPTRRFNADLPFVRKHRFHAPFFPGIPAPLGP